MKRFFSSIVVVSTVLTLAGSASPAYAKSWSVPTVAKVRAKFPSARKMLLTLAAGGLVLAASVDSLRPHPHLDQPAITKAYSEAVLFDVKAYGGLLAAKGIVRVLPTADPRVTSDTLGEVQSTMDELERFTDPASTGNPWRKANPTSWRSVSLPDLKHAREIVEKLPTDLRMGGTLRVVLAGAIDDVGREEKAIAALNGLIPPR